jgi:D-alanyl-lipoteichoic acid acyltransferase DltB (MBOAT superfamily)
LIAVKVWKTVAFATLLHGFRWQWLIWGAAHLTTLSVELYLLNYQW